MASDLMAIQPVKCMYTLTFQVSGCSSSVCAVYARAMGQSSTHRTDGARGVMDLGCQLVKALDWLYDCQI